MMTQELGPSHAVEKAKVYVKMCNPKSRVAAS